MSQTLDLAVSGLYTALNDFNGLPQGALDVADNVESRHKNVMEPRRGFDELVDSAMTDIYLKRLINFWVAGTDRIVGLTSEGNLVYYTGANPWPALPGSVVTNITAPDSINGKSRFVVAGQNLYVTAQDGVRSLASGPASSMIRAGVPKGLNIQASTNGDLSGFLDNNVVLSTTGTIASGGANITKLASTTGIAVDQYVSGVEVAASKAIQDLTYTSVLFGVLGNSTTVAYTGGGTAGSEIVSVVGSAISVQIQSGVSTATQIRTAVNASAPALALISVAVSGTGSNNQTSVGATALTGGLDNAIPAGTKVSSITAAAPLIIETGSSTAGSTSITALASITGIVAGVLVTGTGIPDGTRVVSTSGGGPYAAVLDTAAYQTATGVSFTFSSSVVVTMTANAAASLTATALHFYAGAQVGYRMLFGRVETDIDGNTITRLGAASTSVICQNTTPYSTDVTVTGTIPKNASAQITFVQLYRSDQTASISIDPLDQYSLVYEADLTAGDFTNRYVTITDDVPDSLRGIPLYSGSDREGILQSNNPPPMCWDMCKFRDFTLYGNITQPTTLKFTIVAVGSPSGIQNGDTITLAGTFLGVAFSEAYTAASSEVQASRQFKVFSSGTASQNIADTANSLIKVINYDQAVPVHAILLSSSSDLPGQILLEADNPGYDMFTANASAHTSAYDPTLSTVSSELNLVTNNVAVSKTGEFEAVPATNILPIGDSSSAILRLIPLRDYVIVLKTDGIYKILGTSPGTLIQNPFDLTTKIVGADTAVSLNSGVWMLSNQGVVSISDGGVDAKSIPIDDQLNALVGSYLDNIVDVGFAVGYESDRKYILCLPAGNNAYAEVEYNFQYVTNNWTTWSRNFHTGFIHSSEGKLYISRADPTDTGVSKERKTGTYKDYVDEAIDAPIISVSGSTIGFSDVSDIEAGDILYQSATLFSPILSVDLIANTVVVQYALSFTVGDASVLKAFQCSMTWKQVFGNNPAFMRQFSEGIALFKNTRFNTAAASFVTDFSQSSESVTLAGTGNGLWGLFPWAGLPWGGTIIPSSIRFYIPQNKQIASYLLPTIKIKQGYSDFKFQGLSIMYFNISGEVGK